MIRQRVKIYPKGKTTQALHPAYRYAIQLENGAGVGIIVDERENCFFIQHVDRASDRMRSIRLEAADLLKLLDGEPLKATEAKLSELVVPSFPWESRYGATS